ncbi:peptidoglycan D,D-transpeptidase FtsI family protein [Aquibacillus sediminis]|uniref:peptidoglycan D,D-transpeptidase FtsI family protein n=1 Tax=Aquibacillus sediminis TaxID=2574734 RepID=UPI001108244F|nr:penicillin-binding protein 2 [Aquibacillus sediminis]
MGNKKKKKTQLPFRLNILFILVFALFSLLILQLGVVQILNGEEAQEKIDRTTDTTSKNSVPRGKMYDRFGRVILDNEPVRSIIYTPPKGGDSAEKRLDIAEKLATYITLGEDSEDRQNMIRERDKKEYWYLLNTEEVQGRLSAQELEELSTAEQYQAMLDKITAEDLAQIEWTDELYNELAIKKELDKAYELSPHIIKNENVTEEEYAKVSEHLSELPGIDATINWDRDFVNGNTFANFIGKVTTSDQGVPADQAPYYNSLGYSRNDRVGTSGLEEQYESVLRGRKEQVRFTTDQQGNVVGSEVVVEGQRGNDLELTIDMELQQAVDQIVQEELKTTIEKHPEQNKYMKDALVAMMNPQTGEVLALSGISYDQETEEFSDQSFRVVYDAHRPGSTVKGASVLAGLDSDVISEGERMDDECIRIASSAPKCSWQYLGVVDDIDALKRSSNVYMFHIAMRLGEATYRPNERLVGYNSDKFQTFRNYYSQFGLGVETGVDLPFESTGYKGSIDINAAGKQMDFSIGQFDTYTTLQLAQYVSTIANDGYRVRPRLVNKVREPSLSNDQLGPVVEAYNTDVLNRITMEQDYIERVQEGFRRVMQESRGTAASYFNDAPYNPAGKTGTAENGIYEDGELIEETVNLSLVGYAPFDNPEVVFAVIVPNLGEIESGRHPVNHMIGRRILDKYFELKEERASAGVDDDLPEEETAEELELDMQTEQEQQQAEEQQMDILD